ncbi:MAG: 30S ribosome-binding factor RbfA [Pirellulaceae bacterium]|nr:ribosome-binding factor A [Rhodopirellula sp.]MCH2601056.1 30S ribosome-binding factor RbfA [Pirellulales bacterium]HCA50503.1 30S ribosome-binding factor RbfA [Planctomycetaceae bacterium]|tara:strand:- start:10317 stop:10706 length:390 start_codon:yes stop_codon:yes gene_type:complete
MSSRRVLKAAQAIREVVSTAIITDLRDPRIENVTVTRVEVSGDMRHARIHVSVMGEQTNTRNVLKGLNNAAGFLQRKVANRIDTRYTPKLQFVLDEGLKHSLEVTKILEEVLPPNESQDELDPPSDNLL